MELIKVRLSTIVRKIFIVNFMTLKQVIFTFTSQVVELLCLVSYHMLMVVTYLVNDYHSTSKAVLYRIVVNY